jgi:hypothetical protein
MITYEVVVYKDGTTLWRLDGLIHREDGPAATGASGKKTWFLNGQQMTEAQHKERMNPPVVEEMTMEEICKALGKTIKVVK